MIDIVDDYWKIITIVCAVGIFFFRFSNQVSSVFHTVKNQAKIKSDLENATVVISRLQYIVDSNRRDIERIEGICRDQWESIAILENRIFELRAKR